MEPVIGYQVDLKNKPGLNQLNTSAQFAFNIKRSELLLLVQKDWPVASSSSDSSFTTNPALPLYSGAKKKLYPNSLSFGLGYRKTIAGNETKQHLSFFIFAGLSYQNIRVKYNYDKNNYTILNPDKTQETTGLILGAGIEYMLPIKNGRFFLQVSIKTPPTARISYPSSFQYNSPLSFSLGYSFQIKTYHEEK